MKNKKPLWRIDIAPTSYIHNWPEGNYPKDYEFLGRCQSKPTIKSAFRYAQKIADQIEYPMIVLSWKKWKRARESGRAINYFVFAPKKLRNLYRKIQNEQEKQNEEKEEI